jgi:hypothetical protein
MLGGTSKQRTIAEPSSKVSRAEPMQDTTRSTVTELGGLAPTHIG